MKEKRTKFHGKGAHGSTSPSTSYKTFYFSLLISIFFFVLSQKKLFNCRWTDWMQIWIVWFRVHAPLSRHIRQFTQREAVLVVLVSRNSQNQTENVVRQFLWLLEESSGGRPEIHPGHRPVRGFTWICWGETTPKRSYLI